MDKSTDLRLKNLTFINFSTLLTIRNLSREQLITLIPCESSKIVNLIIFELCNSVSDIGYCLLDSSDDSKLSSFLLNIEVSILNLTNLINEPDIIEYDFYCLYVERYLIYLKDCVSKLITDLVPTD